MSNLIENLSALLKIKSIFVYIFSILLLFFACNNSGSGNAESEIDIPTKIIADSITTSYQLDYDLDSPSKTLIPSKQLNEISGLSFDHQNKSLISINDEKAKIYHLNPNNGRIINEFKFGKAGDYEGIAFADSLIYVIKSNGHIYPFDISKNKGLDRIKTKLSSANDIEGLSLNCEKSRLLIACKGRPSINNQDKKVNYKAIYSYDLFNKKFNKEPVLKIELSNLIYLFQNDQKYSDLSKSKKRQLISRIKRFSPSGIACHPVNNEYFVISAQGKLLVIIDQNNTIKHLEFLNDSHAQAEGICFDDKNNLYIANEARGLSPKIFVYQQITKQIN